MYDLNVLSDYNVFTFLIYLFFYLSAAAGVTIAVEPQFVLISDDDIKTLKVDQLRQELKSRGLDNRGLKNELKERLEKAMVNKISMANIDLFQPKTDLFSTHALISVHFKTVRYFFQSIFSLFSYIKNL